jgi:DNA polymerase-3 subunit alpha
MCEFTLKAAGTAAEFRGPAPASTIESYFEKVARDGFHRPPQADRSADRAGRLRHPLVRLRGRASDKEIGVIRRVGFAGYFSIVWDFIRYCARSTGIPRGPRPRIGGGQPRRLLAGITDIDPHRERADLRALPQRGSASAPPTSKSTSAENRRGEVIEYVTAKYGPRERGPDHHVRAP